jgi:hypothetical protein
VDALKDFDFLLVLFFIVPGFISMRVYALLRPTDSGPLKENLYEAITFSVMNYVLMEWTVPPNLAGTHSFSDANRVGSLCF